MTEAVVGWRGAGTVLAILALASACGSPVRVVRMDPHQVHRTLTGNVLSTGEPSVASRIVLQRYGLAERYEDDRPGALAELHRMAILEGERQPKDLFALAELSFDHAARGGGRAYALATAVYAWTLLFEPGVPGTELDPRLRIAADLYNRGLTVALATNATSVELRPGQHALPFGSVDVVVDPTGLRWGDRRLVGFTAGSELGVIGLRNRYRQPGIGAPLNATTAPVDPEQGFRDFVFPRVKVPVTALLRVDDAQRGLGTGRLRGRLEVYAASETQQVDINGRSVALEYEPSSALADALTAAPIWRTELRGFLAGDLIRRERLTRLGAIEPYRSDRVPVVLVHGTASSPGRWADMLNDLANDPPIRERFQFWAFSYDTGNPIVYSGMVLREALAEAVGRLDPDGNDVCLRHMVVIGHSQGGLLAKLTAIDSGSRLWDGVSRKPVDELKLSAATRDLLRRAFFVTPLPFVRRVVFIATPQRGSYRAVGWVRALVQRLVTLPSDVARVGADLLTNAPELKVQVAMSRLPTSIDNMSPGHPFIQSLSAIPLPPDVTTNSIIAVKGDGPPETGNDGVVEYRSAHVEDVESELVVRSGHSTQSNPATIEEVRRILRRHAAAVFDGEVCRPPVTVATAP